MVFIIILGWILMKTQYNLKFQNYRNFLAKKRELKGTPYKYTETTRKFAVVPVEGVVDYEGEPFTIGLNDKTPRDFFMRLYCIRYETTLRILPA